MLSHFWSSAAIELGAVFRRAELQRGPGSSHVWPIRAHVIGRDAFATSHGMRDILRVPFPYILRHVSSFTAHPDSWYALCANDSRPLLPRAHPREFTNCVCVLQSGHQRVATGLFLQRHVDILPLYEVP